MSQKLGHTYKDIITGFVGVAVGHVTYLTGCNQTLIAPKATDTAKFPESVWIDDQRLEKMEGIPVFIDNGSNPGCDREPPKR